MKKKKKPGSSYTEIEIDALRSMIEKKDQEKKKKQDEKNNEGKSDKPER